MKTHEFNDPWVFLYLAFVRFFVLTNGSLK